MSTRTRFPKGTPKKLRRKYSRWKPKHFHDWLFASIVLGASFRKNLP